MGKIVKTLTVEGDKAASQITCLLDSGAGSSLVRRDVAERIMRGLQELHHPKVFHLANGEPLLQARYASVLEVDMKGKKLSGDFYIVDNLAREMIIGVDFMQAWEIKLDMKAEDYTVGVDPEAIEIAGC